MDGPGGHFFLPGVMENGAMAGVEDDWRCRGLFLWGFFLLSLLGLKSGELGGFSIGCVDSMRLAGCVSDIESAPYCCYPCLMEVYNVYLTLDRNMSNVIMTSTYWSELLSYSSYCMLKIMISKECGLDIRCKWHS